MLFLLACFSEKSNNDTGASSTYPSSCPSADLSSDMAFDESCQEYDGVDVAGGTSYFLGDLCISGTSVGSEVSGRETWRIIANDAWREVGQNSCSVVWNTIGVVTEPTGCPTCTIGMTLTASIDRSLTDCPPDLWTGEETLQENYDVFIADDGNLQWFFSGSGTRFASGIRQDSSLGYISDPTCVWF